jgi:hypothetical protein
LDGRSGQACAPEAGDKCVHGSSPPRWDHPLSRSKLNGDFPDGCGFIRVSEPEYRPRDLEGKGFRDYVSPLTPGGRSLAIQSTIQPNSSRGTATSAI